MLTIFIFRKNGQLSFNDGSNQKREQFCNWQIFTKSWQEKYKKLKIIRWTKGFLMHDERDVWVEDEDEFYECQKNSKKGNPSTENSENLSIL